MDIKEFTLKELEKEGTIPLVPFLFDLEQSDWMDSIEKTLKEKQPMVKMLINCAGFGKIGSWGVWRKNRTAAGVATDLFGWNCFFCD